MASAGAYVQAAAHLHRLVHPRVVHRAQGCIAPALTARESVKVREILVKRYERYYAEHDYLEPETSSFIKDRYECFSRFDLGLEDIARLELVFHILSDEAVLEDCRRGLSKAPHEQDGVCTFDPGERKRIPSTIGASFQRPEPALRSRGLPRVWWWLDALPCHFASTEMLAFAALIVLRFDIRQLSGHRVAPTTAKPNPGTSVEQPDYDIDVEILSRDRRKWAVTMSGSDKAMMISAEDIAAVSAE
ncbi:hypothetical protein AAE478_008680 [Parahypoxylon ruwenzoriense]